MQTCDVKIGERREVVVDVLATTLYEMIATGWRPRAAPARPLRPRESPRK